MSNLVPVSFARDVARLVRKRMAPQRVRVIPLGTDAVPAREAAVASVRAKYGLERDYILWTGTIEPRKNLPRLLEAYRSLDANLDLVVCGPRGWNEDLDALIAPVKEHVRILGFVPRSDLAGLYAGARIFCWPSLMEGFGFPVLEAMAQGTPVVTSLGTSTEEIAGDAAILVDPRDAGAIAAGVERILGDEALEAKLAAAGRARASDFTWERTARSVANLREVTMRVTVLKIGINCLAGNRARRGVRDLHRASAHWTCERCPSSTTRCSRPPLRGGSPDSPEVQGGVCASRES